MFEPAAREQHVAFDQRLDDGLVGIALVALVVDDALAFEARRVICQRPVLVDGVGDGRIDSARFEIVRASVGRRSCDQIAAWDWEGDARPERFESVLYPDVGHTYTPAMRAEMLAWFERWLRAGDLSKRVAR